MSHSFGHRDTHLRGECRPYSACGSAYTGVWVANIWADPPAYAQTPTGWEQGRRCPVGRWQDLEIDVSQCSKSLGLRLQNTSSESIIKNFKMASAKNWTPSMGPSWAWGSVCPHWAHTHEVRPSHVAHYITFSGSLLKCHLLRKVSPDCI